MSYWVYLRINTGGRNDAEIYSRNMTSNVAPMWRKAGIDLQECDGKPVTDVLPVLRAAVAAINDPSEYAAYKALEPSNGWGDYAGAVQFLEELLRACEDNPACTVDVSY